MIYISYEFTKSDRASQHEAGLRCRDRLFRLLGYEELIPQIYSGNNGRPCIGRADIDFSVTHSAHLAACAVICNKDCPVPDDISMLPFSGSRVGFDAELIDRSRSVENLSKVCRRWFGEDAGSHEELFDIWTRHEAVGKMYGDGVLCKAGSEGCYVRSFSLENGDETYRLCICAK